MKTWPIKVYDFKTGIYLGPGTGTLHAECAGDTLAGVHAYQRGGVWRFALPDEVAFIEAQGSQVRLVFTKEDRGLKC